MMLIMVYSMIKELFLSTFGISVKERNVYKTVLDRGDCKKNIYLRIPFLITMIQRLK